VFAALVIRILVKSLLITLFVSVYFIFSHSLNHYKLLPKSFASWQLNNDDYILPLGGSPLKYVCILTNLTI
jgi:energy-converting hydrogenase Eha subunit F